VQGIQGDVTQAGYLMTACTCKHLDAYSLEASDGHTRHNFDAKVTQQDMADTYVLACVHVLRVCLCCVVLMCV